MTLYKGKYRIESTRLEGWDYSKNGYYFVTICTRNGECLLGKVVDGVMQLSTAGKIVEEEWCKTEQIRNKVTLDKWIIMPNHLHGIVIINTDVETPRRGVSDIPNGGKAISQHNETFRQGRLKSGSLGAIIGQFKSICTKRILTAGHNFAWQSRFYDHIIRNEKTLDKIREYIVNNPLKWELDKDNPVNLYM